MDQSAKFEKIRIPLIERTRGLDAVTGVLGIPEWWPTGERVAIAIAHDTGSDHENPLIEYLHRALARSQILSIRFNFPFAEKSRRAKADPMEALEMTYKCALSVLGRDPTATPAHLFLAGVGLGAKVAARLASTERLQIGGLLMLSYPLHPPGKPDAIEPEGLYRIISPMLFVHGTEDPRCKPEALRRVLSRIGAPTTPYAIPGMGAELIAPENIPPPPPTPTEEDLARVSSEIPPPPPKPTGPGEVLAQNTVNWIEHILDGV